MSELLTHFLTVRTGAAEVCAMHWGVEDRLHIATRDNQVLLIDLNEPRELFLHAALPVEHSTSCAWSNDGNYLAISTFDGVSIWNFFTQRIVAEIPARIRIVSRVCWSPLDQLLAVAARGIRIIDTGSEKTVCTISGHMAGVNCMAWAPDSSRLASLDEWGSLRMSDTSTGESVEVLNTGDTVGMGIAWSYDGRHLAFPLGDKVAILDTATGSITAELEHRGVSWMGFARVDPLLVTKGSDNSVRAWNTENGNLLAEISEPVSNYVLTAGAVRRFRCGFATLGNHDRDIRLWHFHPDLLEVTAPVRVDSPLTVPVLDVSPVVTAAKTARGLERSGLTDLIEAVDTAQGSEAKGKSLEVLCAAFFCKVRGFTVQPDARNSTEQIDLVILNETDLQPFAKNGEIILAECKNWSGKCGKSDFVLLGDKMLNRNERCTLAFLISWNGFAGTIADCQLRGSREPQVIVALTGDDIREALAQQDVAGMLRKRYYEVLMK